MKEFSIGTMYWIDPKKTPDELVCDLRKIQENGISLVRTFICWEYVEIRENEFDFTIFDRFFRSAEAVGVKVMATLIFYLPFFRVRDLLAQGIDDRERRIPCLDRPEVRNPLEVFFAETVSRYNSSPAFKIWNVWNEPTDLRCDCDHSLRAFAGYLQKRYPNMEKLREAWAGEYFIFNPVLPESIGQLDEKFLRSVLDCANRSRDTGMRYEWDMFQLKHSADHLRYLISLVRRYDQVHECHTNPCVGCENPVFIGIDPFVFGKIQESISISVHPFTHFTGLQHGLDHSSELPMISQIDLARSWGGNKDAYIGEYQAGSTFAKPHALTPTGKDIFATLLHSLGRGLRGVIFWQWQAWRHSTFEVGEFSLRNPSDGGETERSCAGAEFAGFYREHRDFFDRAAMPQPQVAIFISMDQAAYDHLSGNVEKMHTHLRCALQCHRSLAQSGIPADFVSESVMNEKVLSAYKVIFIPQVRLVSAETAAILRKFVADGGAVWADGRFAFLDEYVCLRRRVPGHGLDELFGGFECDEIAPRPDMIIRSREYGDITPCRELQRFQAFPESQVIADCNGFPAALRNHYGRGCAELWGTPLAYADMLNGTNQLDRIIAGFAVKNGVSPIIEPVGRGCMFSVLESNTKRLFIVTNCYAECAAFSLPQNSGIEQWYGSVSGKPENGNIVWMIPPGETLCTATDLN